MVVSVTVDLNIGENIIEWKEASGYADLEAKINVTDTSLSCVTMDGGVCSLVAPEPYISLIGFTVKGFLAEGGDIQSWITAKGGKRDISATEYSEIVLGYTKVVPLDFEVPPAHLMTIQYYYFYTVELDEKWITEGDKWL